MPRKPMTRKVFEVLLHGELLEGEEDCHCPICGKWGGDLEAFTVANVGAIFEEDDNQWEPSSEVLGWSMIIVECPCGFIADDSFFRPDEPFPQLRKDEEYPGCWYLEGCSLDLKAVYVDGKWQFTNSKWGRTYYELLRIVNANYISELPESLVSEVEWLRRLASKVFDNLKHKRRAAGVPSNPFRR